MDKVPWLVALTCVHLLIGFCCFVYTWAFARRKGYVLVESEENSPNKCGPLLLTCCLSISCLKMWMAAALVSKELRLHPLVEGSAWMAMCLWMLRRKAIPKCLKVWWALCVPPYFSLFSIAIVRFATGNAGIHLDDLVDLASFPLLAILIATAACGQNPHVRLKEMHFSSAGICSLLMFSWMDPVFSLGAKRPLELADLPELGGYDSLTSFEALQMTWTKLRVSPRPSLMLALLESFRKEALLTGLLAGTNLLASYAGPYLVYVFVDYLGREEESGLNGFAIAFGFLCSKSIELLSERHLFLRIQLLGLRVRSALTALVYRKGLRLCSSSRVSHSSGKMINYMSSDVGRISNFSWHLHSVWILLVQVTLAVLILYNSIGLATVPCLAAIVFSVSLNFPLARAQEKVEGRVVEATDMRMKATLESLKNMKILKIHSWEEAYLAKLEGLRNIEYSFLRRLLCLQAFTQHMLWSSPMFVSLVTFSACKMLSIPLSVKSVLSSLATFQLLQSNLENFSGFIPMLAQTKVSLNRLSLFLQEEEIPRNVASVLDAGDVTVISITDGTFSWEASMEKPAVCKLNLEIKQGAVLGICGVVGSGKSSLVSCILGEIPKLAGKVEVRGRIAYVSQSAWIQSGTIEENIRFGKPMDRLRYDNTIKVCQLSKDLNMLPYGDQTQIGERGVNLSGGQKQRIQMARAVYDEADIYLLDDPFSALDAQTLSKIIQECISGALKSKTIVMVTHQMQVLEVTDRILVLTDGRVAESLTYDELLKQTSLRRPSPGASIVGNRKAEHEESYCATTMMDHDEPQKQSQLVQDEDRERGAVSFATYWIYLTSVRKGALVPAILAAHTMFQLLHIANNWWLASSTLFSNSVLLFYGLLSLAGSLFLLLRIILLSSVGLTTAQKFFLGMLHSVFHAPMSFFDSTPTGRILTRASADQNSLDLYTSFRLGGLAFSTIEFLLITGIMLQAAPQILPVLLLPVLLPVAGACMWLQCYYAASIRELPRLIAIQKAPVIHHFAESLSGAPTIRAFGQEKCFMDRNLRTIDNHSRPVLYNFGAMECMALRLGLLVNLFFSAFMVLLVSLPADTVNPTLAGIAVTYALKLNMIQCSLVWDLCDAEKRIISAERIQQYTNIAKEAEWCITDIVPAEWPSEGNVVLDNLKVRYMPAGPLVLKGITCRLPGGKKIGIVGRTGSGKSTLVQALFRIVEPCGGRILIDGVDVSTIGLHDLRSRLSIIPQEPTMFEGTVRYNLDPLGKHSDGEIWEVLRKCQTLSENVSGRAHKLDALVSENGENWSVGQRQLFCLGRILLQKARIVVLDEATASVDTETHDVFQSVILKEFAGCTVITVAHRLQSIMSSYMVMVLSDGEIVEYDAPYKLMGKTTSHFSTLVSEHARSP